MSGIRVVFITASLKLIDALIKRGGLEILVSFLKHVISNDAIKLLVAKYILVTYFAVYT